MFGEAPGTLSHRQAGALYCLPFTHLESVVLGVMIGRGALAGISRLFPLFCALALALGALNVWASHGLVSARSLGFQFPLRLNYIHVWGYSILALVAASLCARNGVVAVAVEKTKRPPWVEAGLVRLGSLTCGVYLFHGIIMATGVAGSRWLSRENAPFLRLLLFAITVMESFLLAWAFAWFLQVAIPRLSETCLKTARRWSGHSGRETKGAGTNTADYS